MVTVLLGQTMPFTQRTGLTVTTASKDAAKPESVMHVQSFEMLAGAHTTVRKLIQGDISRVSKRSFLSWITHSAKEGKRETQIVQGVGGGFCIWSLECDLN